MLVLIVLRPSLASGAVQAADDGRSAGSAQRQQQQGDEPFNGSAVEWVLRKADESLDEIEENPPEFVKTIYEVSSGPIGACRGRRCTCLRACFTRLCHTSCVLRPRL